MAQLDSFFHYFPVDDDVLRWGAYVTGAGVATILPNKPYPPFGHPMLYHFDWRRGRTLPEFQMVLIAQGVGEFESEPTGKVTFSGPTLMWLFPGVWHRYRPVQQVGWTERWFSFNGDLVHRLWGQGLIDPARAAAAIGDADALVEKYDAMLQRIHTNPLSHTALHSLQVLRLLAESIESITGILGTSEKRESAPQRPVDPIVEQALAIIQTQSHRPISIEQVAQELSVARRTLDRRFAAATGKSILEEINEYRLNRAKRLLAETDLPIRSIANLVGFASPERLGLLFTRREGVSPSEFRQRKPRSVSGGASRAAAHPLRSGR
jgi:AraC-like DNA-binding protein